MVLASEPKGSGRVRSWGCRNVVPPSGHEGLGDVKSLKAGDVWSGPPPEALVTSGEMSETKELLLRRPGGLALELTLTD